ncbi:hypothetical protein A3K73_08195 [Candidatus Pacearchaeota archaeon RBG_13_36_9]|nr:MAG: hypothetical protein A3K73_08195 [Candidatus Pacearchaeota archaeon RBG_13_36_9]
MNKIIFFSFLLILSFSFSSIVSAADIAYILKDSSKPQASVISAIGDSGYSYELIDDSKIPSTNFSKYKMILVMDETLDNYDKIPITKKKSLVSSTYYLKTWKIAEYAGSQTSTGYVKARVYKNNSITEGIPPLFETYNQKEVVLNFLSYAPKRAPGLQRVVITDNYYEYPVIGIINPGGELYEGGTASERTAFFGITAASYWTGTSKQLFKNTLQWVMIGEDSDGDGFYYDDDCNDNSSSVYPGAEEIPYNGVDEDCNQEDLEDVDGDGYKADIIGGDDCEDEDETINPGASSVYDNCRNDAPIIEDDIGKITVDENWEVIIEVEAEDPEGDAITYSTNDSRFTQDGNIFTWQTNYYDKGTYLFSITASDGNLSSEIEVEVEVINKNQKPVCDTIPALEWEEDKNASLNLSEYCSDLDGDVLEYYIYNTSSSSEIILESLEDGIANFSSEKEWHGEDWIVFSASDGKSTEVTNKIILKVNGINDAPAFAGEMKNITWNEDTNLIDYLALEDYFSDVDSEMNYGFKGNTFIDIQIDNGKASFIPEKDWYGEETVIFSASDGEFSAYSNEVVLKVLDMNEPPEFFNFSCDQEITEDIEEKCNVTAQDFENDSYQFSISDEDKLNCEFNGEELTYVSYPDYFGLASCTLKISDGYGYNNYLFEADITGVNDAPRIIPSPNTGNVLVLTGKNKSFAVEVMDVDGDAVETEWKLNGEATSSGTSYLFNKALGTYNLTVAATDGKEQASYDWVVRVGGMNEFTCSEVGGNICKENEMCYAEDILGVKDTGSCCASKCTPKFEEIERCDKLNSSIIIKIKDPDSGEKFEIGDTIAVNLKLESSLEADSDFDVSVYLYDLTEDDVIDEDGEQVQLINGEAEELEFSFETEEDSGGNEYAVFVKAEDDICNEQFVKIAIEREKNSVVIKDIRSNGDFSCGGQIDFSVKVQNTGSSSQDVKIRVENSELGIKEESEEFELEKYDKKNDEATKSFNIEIPEDATGNYKLLTRVTFNGEERQNEQEISIECNKVVQDTKPIEKISLGKKEPATAKEGEETEESKGREIVLAATLATTVIVIILIIYLVYVLFFRKS